MAVLYGTYRAAPLVQTPVVFPLLGTANNANERYFYEETRYSKQKIKRPGVKRDQKRNKGQKRSNCISRESNLCLINDLPKFHLLGVLYLHGAHRACYLRMATMDFTTKPLMHLLSGCPYYDPYKSYEFVFSPAKSVQ